MAERHDRLLSTASCCGGAGSTGKPGAGPAACAEPAGQEDAASASPAAAKGGMLFEVRGLDCAEEVRVLTSAVGPVVGGAVNLHFDVLRGRMRIDPAAGPVPASEIIAASASVGLQAVPWETRDDAQPASFWRRHARLIATALSAVLVATAATMHVAGHGSLSGALDAGGANGHPLPTAVALMYLLAVIIGGVPLLPKAWSAARRLSPDMNLLMTVAVLGALGIGEWFEAATIVVLFSISLVLESWSVGRARRAVEALLDVAPKLAWLLAADGSTTEVAPDAVRVGDRVLVREGERIPIDGVVRRGTSAVDQAPVTGESVPVLKEPEAQVFAATINGDGVLEIECTQTGEDTTLARIIRMVEEAQARRAPAEIWVERFARVYTPAVMALAVLVAVVPPLLFAGATGAEWLYSGLVVLVIACPCALVISTPVSVVAGLASAAKFGVLIKGGIHLESPARLVAVAFDKTGTLTVGRPEVVQAVPLDDHTEAELLSRAAALEARSAHPIAKAIVARADVIGAPYEPAKEVTALPGKGVTGRVGARALWLGSHRYLHERDQETPAIHERLERMSDAGRTVVVVGNDRHVCGMIAIADAPRPEAREAVAGLKKAGVRHVAMLTGDNEGTARAVGEALGLDDVRAELLPQEKLEAVRALVQEHRTVAMVGDGINDAPAMAQASLAIAMGVAGSDAAIETADIALMSDDLNRLPWLVRHARRTLRIVRQNIWFALSVKAAFVGLTFLSVASLWAAIAADTGASLLVIGNALRLLRRAP